MRGDVTEEKTKAMIAKRFAQTVVGGMFAVLAASAAAQVGNVGYLHDSPMYRMTEADFALFRQTVKDALDNAADNSENTWSNPSTGAHGMVKPLTSEERDGKTCRKVEITTEAGDVGGVSRGVMCRQPDGRWKVVASH